MGRESYTLQEWEKKLKECEDKLVVDADKLSLRERNVLQTSRRMAKSMIGVLGGAVHKPEKKSLYVMKKESKDRRAQDEADYDAGRTVAKRKLWDDSN